LLFSIIAHDLRNPFQAILGLSQSLSKGVASKDSPSIERRAQGIVEAASRAHALMESLFSWANAQMSSVSVSSDRPLVGKRSLTGFGDHHPNDGNPPRTGAYRSRLDRGQPIARESVQQRIREAMGQHVRHRAALLCVGE
jgi:His Kinase A (phospho-acceptor) domain